VANERDCTLFEMAALRASSVLKPDSIRAAADVTVLVAGIMVIGNEVYFLNAGHRGAYPFRPQG